MTRVSFLCVYAVLRIRSAKLRWFGMSEEFFISFLHRVIGSGPERGGEVGVTRCLRQQQSAQSTRCSHATSPTPDAFRVTRMSSEVTLLASEPRRRLMEPLATDETDSPESCNDPMSWADEIDFFVLGRSDATFASLAGWKRGAYS